MPVMCKDTWSEHDITYMDFICTLILCTSDVQHFELTSPLLKCNRNFVTSRLRSNKCAYKCLICGLQFRLEKSGIFFNLESGNPEIKYLLIAYICAKNYRNRFVYVRVIMRHSSDIFGDTV